MASPDDTRHDGRDRPDSAAIHARRFEGIRRDYTTDDVERLAGTLRIEHTLAERGARRLWELLHTRDFVPSLGAVTGNQAVQMVKAGLEAIYVSGWQVAADANVGGQTYLFHLTNLVPSALHVEHYAAIVKEKAILCLQKHALYHLRYHIIRNKHS